MMRTWKNRRFLAILISLVMMISLIPVQVLAAGNPFTVTPDSGWSYSSGTLTISTAGTYTISMEENAETDDVISVGVDGVTLNLQDVVITSSTATAISSTGNLTINVLGDNNLSGSNDGGIMASGSLTINGSGTMVVQHESAAIYYDNGFSSNMKYMGYGTSDYDIPVTVGGSSLQDASGNAIKAIQFTPSAKTADKTKYIFAKWTEGGTISLDGVVAEYVTALKGTEMEVLVTPDAGYQLVDLRLDGANILELLQGNVYPLTVWATQPVEATFEKIPMPSLEEALADGLYAEDASGLYLADEDWDALELVTNAKALESLTYLLLAAEVDVEGFDFGAIMDADADVPVTMGDFAEALNLVRSAITGEEIVADSSSTSGGKFEVKSSDNDSSSTYEGKFPNADTYQFDSNGALITNSDMGESSAKEEITIIDSSQAISVEGNAITAEGIDFSQISLVDSGVIFIGSETSLVDSGVIPVDTSLVSVAEGDTAAVTSAQGSYEAVTMESFMIPVSSLDSLNKPDIYMNGNASLYFNLSNDEDQNSEYPFYGNLTSTATDRLIINDGTILIGDASGYTDRTAVVEGSHFVADSADGEGAISAYISGYVMDTTAVNMNLGYMVLLVDRAFGVDEDFAAQVANGENALIQGEFLTSDDLAILVKSAVGDSTLTNYETELKDALNLNTGSGVFEFQDWEETDPVTTYSGDNSWFNSVLKVDEGAVIDNGILLTNLTGETSLAGGTITDFGTLILGEAETATATQDDAEETAIGTQAGVADATAISGTSYRGFATLVGSEIVTLADSAMYAIVEVGDGFIDIDDLSSEKMGTGITISEQTTLEDATNSGIVEVDGESSIKNIAIDGGVFVSKGSITTENLAAG